MSPSSIPYTTGDVCIIPLSNGNQVFAKLVFAPAGELKQAVGLTIYLQSPLDHPLQPIQTFNLMQKSQQVLFRGNQKLKNGLWPLIGHINLTESDLALQHFIYAGHLYHNETCIRNISPDEFKHHTNLTVCGFQLLDQLLCRNQEDIENT